MFNIQAGIASAHFFAGRYADTSHWAEVAAGGQPNHLIAACIGTASTARVKLGLSVAAAVCPLFPRKETSAGAAAGSHSCQQRTSRSTSKC